MTERSMLPEHQQSSATNVIDMINRQSMNPLVLASPLRTILPAIKQWIAETEARIARLERDK